ncbi:MAG: glycosyltransferase [Burkholderiales bacterium]
MSRILLAWELGAGFGHLGPFLSIAPKLLERGHVLHVAAREIAGACNAVGRLPITVHQAPLCLNTYSGLQDPPLNFAEILMRYGYLEPPMLQAMITAWRSLLHVTGAELLIADHAPTALIAARLSGIPTAVIGTPFSVPPDVHPTPNMRPWVDVPAARLADSDARVLAVINAALPAGAAPITGISEIFSGASRFFIGVPETDVYGKRPEATYFGLAGVDAGGISPVWPEGTGKRVFVYLRAEYPHSDTTMAALIAGGARVIAYISGANAAALQRYAGLGAVAVSERVDLEQVFREADLCVTHGPGTTLAALRLGVPVLVLPRQLENFLFASALQRIGVCGLLRPDGNPEDIRNLLADMLENAAYRDRARGFADRYSKPSVDTIIDQVIAQVESLAATQEKGRK